MSPISRPARDEVLVFAGAAGLRAWLEANHDAADEAWIGYYRKGVPKTSITYPQLVDEVLCFGWIDGITYRVDDEVTASRITPRRRSSNWSAVNIAKVAELRPAGRMHPAGIQAFEGRDRRRDAIYSYERPEKELPAEWLARFGASTPAWAYWLSETPSYRRTTAHWVVSATREETRARRFAALLADSAAGRRVKPFRVGSGESP